VESTLVEAVNTSAFLGTHPLELGVGKFISFAQGVIGMATTCEDKCEAVPRSHSEWKVLMEQVSPGYDVRDVSIAELQIPQLKYTDAQAIDFYTRLLERLRHTQGSESSVGITNFLLGRLPDSATFNIAGRDDRITLPVTTDTVDPEFFSANEDSVASRAFLQCERPGRTRRQSFSSTAPLAQSASCAMEILIRGTGAHCALQVAVRALAPNHPILHFATHDAT
jgi:hypothetical protein